LDDWLSGAAVAPIKEAPAVLHSVEIPRDVRPDWHVGSRIRVARDPAVIRLLAVVSPRLAATA